MHHVIRLLNHSVVEAATEPDVYVGLKRQQPNLN
jgi:hypothetical protein